MHAWQIRTLYSGQYTKRSIAKNKADKRVRLCLTETRRRRERHRAVAVSRVEARYLARKRLAFYPAKFEPALTLARSDWQKRHVDEDAIAHGSEIPFEHLILLRLCGPDYQRAPCSRDEWEGNHQPNGTSGLEGRPTERKTRRKVGGAKYVVGVQRHRV